MSALQVLFLVFSRPYSEHVQNFITEFLILWIIMMAERSVCLTVPFPTPELAALAYEVLNVDKEVKRSEVRREITAEGTDLEVTFHGIELKRLRLALNGVLRNILLIAKSIEQFKNYKQDA